MERLKQFDIILNEIESKKIKNKIVKERCKR
jgi:hypothetical protein